jgi:pyruvate,water dikinase
VSFPGDLGPDDGRVVWLDDPRAADERHTGPKMASLARLRAWGFAVPEACTVPVAAFESFLRHEGLDRRIEAVLAGCDADDDDELTAAADAIQRLLAAAPTPDELHRHLLAVHDELCGRLGDVNPQLAVRSSAAAEDGADASFAGQFLTELGVCGAEELVASIRRCWASLFVPRALAYRLRAGVTLAACPMAVGIVRLVHARAAGVAFSRHPVTGARDRMVIEATFGLGEALVSGLVTPDRAEVDSEDGRILDYQVGPKQVASSFVPSEGRVVEHAMPSALRDRRVLSDAQVAAIAAGVAAIEAKMGGPVDVEWVVDTRSAPEEITYVQARPQTVGGPPESERPSFLATVLSTAFGAAKGTT